MFLEVGLQPVQRPRAEGQAQLVGLGQCGGDYLGALLGVVGGWPTGPRSVLQAVDAGFVEACNPGVNSRTRNSKPPGDSAASLTVTQSEEDLGPLHEASLCRSGSSQLLQVRLFL
jgi:hypothetical protein